MAKGFREIVTFDSGYAWIAPSPRNWPIRSRSRWGRLGLPLQDLGFPPEVRDRLTVHRVALRAGRHLLGGHQVIDTVAAHPGVPDPALGRVGDRVLEVEVTPVVEQLELVLVADVVVGELLPLRRVEATAGIEGGALD